MKRKRTNTKYLVNGIFSFDKYLKEKLKDPEYRKRFEQEQRKLRNGIRKARAKQKKSQ